MATLTLILHLAVASAGDCYLVTAEEIRPIPCDFSAPVTDALRYAAEDTPEARARMSRQEQRDVAAPRRATRGRTFGRGPTRNGSGR
jgi:hypothetical protein